MDQKGERRSKIPKNIKTKNLQATLTWPRACVFLCVVCCLPITSNSQCVQFYGNLDFPSHNSIFSFAAEGHGSSIFQQRRELYCSWSVVCGRIHPWWICDESGKRLQICSVICIEIAFTLKVLLGLLMIVMIVMIVLWLYFLKRTQSLSFRSSFWHIYRLDYDIWTLLQNNPKGKEVSGGINWSWVGSCGSWLMGMWSFIILFTYFYMFIIFL